MYYVIKVSEGSLKQETKYIHSSRNSLTTISVPGGSMQSIVYQFQT